MKADLSNLGKWVDELTASIEDLEKKLDTMSGGFDPSAYTYEMPFFDIPNREVQRVSDGHFVAVEDCMVWFHIETATIARFGYINPDDDSDRYLVAYGTAPNAETHGHIYGCVPLKTGQKVFWEGNVTGSQVYTFAVLTGELAPANNSLLTRAKNKIKKIMKGGH